MSTYEYFLVQKPEQSKMSNSNNNGNGQIFTPLDLMILILSVYVILVLFLEAVFEIPPEVKEVLEAADTGICFIFLADFFIRLRRSKEKREFLKWNWIDFVSSIPMIEILRVGRFARVIRVLRLLRGARSAKMLLTFAFRNRKQSVSASVGTISIILLVWAAISMLIVEKARESNIANAEEALWWSFVTMTTIGYGDFYPVTLEGRLVAAALIAAGVGLFGTFTGLMTSLFIEEPEDEPALGQDYMQKRFNKIDDKLLAIEQELKRLREKGKY